MQFVLIIGALVLGQSLILTVIEYGRQKQSVLEGVDQKLLVATHLARNIPPPAYHDGIFERSSVSPEVYECIVDRYNRLCLDLGLQYLWSCMVLDGKVVFTTATSPGKDVRKGDHAGFLDVHRDPRSFDRVFATMKPDYSSFRNEWGNGRMVLVPFTDAHGRPYCVGASVRTDEVTALLRRDTLRTSLVRLLILSVALLAGMLIARSLSRPVIELKKVADNIAHGDMDVDVPERGTSEMRSLARSIREMRDGIRTTIWALRVEIEQRRKAEEALQKQQERLEELVRQRTAELERSNRDLEQFAYIASHDLQEPLRKIRSFTELLAERFRPLVDETGARYVSFVIDGANRMQQLIQDLLTYSRVSRQSTGDESADLDLAFAQAIANLEDPIRESVAVVTSDKLPRVRANGEMMVHVFQNLIGNSLKFRRGPPRIHVDASLQNGEWIIAVRDNGIGIPQEHLPRIFEVFQRLHSRSEYPGTGMGLSICKKIVERHGGRIWAESAPGQGSTFLFSLPAGGTAEPA
jgi:signal transduction histidine kinase